MDFPDRVAIATGGTGALGGTVVTDLLSDDARAVRSLVVPVVG